MTRQDSVQMPDWQPPSPRLVRQRRRIYDRNGVLLASSVPTRSLYAHPYEVTNPTNVVETLARHVPELDKRTALRRLTSESKFVWLKRHLTPEEQEAVLWAGLPGVYLHDDYQRVYPQGRLFSHVLGYTNVDGEGLAGVEKYFDKRLAGGDQGEALHLSLDARLQRSLRTALTEAREQFQAVAATGAVFHIPTGQARAMVSLPDYDPNHPLDYSADARFNRLSVGQYELGSLFKAISVAMAMEHGGLSIHDGFDTSQPVVFKGNTIRDYHGKKRWLSVPEILAYSSNIGTAKMADVVGIEGHRAFLHRLGLLDRMETELPEVARPTEPNEWKKINSVTISFGHGVSTTPLQTAVAAAALVNGGKLIAPTFLRRSAEQAEAVATQVIKPHTSDAMRFLFRYNVESGSGRRAEVDGFFVGGKTGTAEKVVNGRYSSDKRFNAFLAAFPMDDPEYVVLVIVDEPKPAEGQHSATAGLNAAPMVGAIIRRSAPMLGVEPRFKRDRDTLQVSY
jgi:cell division protein FtsI (penicillin-binding protein 3)